MSIPKRFARKDMERGQALVLLALGFVGIAAFVGLTVDAGILFSNVGQLRRATDAASLAAANQFREGRTPAELSNMAFEFLQLNGLSPSPSGVVAKVCDLQNPGSSYDDASLCPGVGETPRKYVNVETTLDVNFAFLPIVGWKSTTIRANSISEAASVDLVLALDVSNSMSFDLCFDLRNNDEGIGGELATEIDDCKQFGTGQGSNGLSESDIATCNAATVDEDKCHPFEEVRDAAKRLVDRMYFPYDRLSIVTFSAEAAVVLELDDCNFPSDPVASRACVKSVLDNLEVALERSPPVDCSFPPDPRGCTNTNFGDALKLAGGRYCLDDGTPSGVAGNGVCDRGEMREEAVWITILLSDGAANAAVVNAPPTGPDDWRCPNTTWAAPPFCRDDSSSTRHDKGPPGAPNPLYDTEDYARDMADFVGCPSETLPQPSGCSAAAPGGQGAVVFSIGLGDLVWDNQSGGDADAGEQLLRYLAAVGDDGDPGTDPCASVAAATSCGNYYFSPSGEGLIQVFEAIASRIFTRITH